MVPSGIVLVALSSGVLGLDTCHHVKIELRVK